MSVAQRDASASPAIGKAPSAWARWTAAPPAWLGLAALLVLAAGVYTLLALLHRVPIVYPDEALYGQLAASIAHGDGLSWRHQTIDLRSPLYVYAISPAWMVAGGYAAYTVAKVMGAVVVCTTAIPIWLIVRRVAPAWLALAAAALTLAGTWMVAAAGIVTETFSLPLATASVCAAVAAVRKPGSRWVWIALGFAVLATATRIQCVALVPALLLTLMLDVARAGRLWRVRFRAHRVPIVVLGVVLVVGGVAYEALGAKLTGSGGGYDVVVGLRPTVMDTLRLSGRQALVLALSGGMLPLFIVLGCMLRPAAWRDEAVGPMLAVLVPVVLGFCLESGYFFAGLALKDGLAPSQIWTSHRYVYYAAPLLISTALLAAYRPRLLNPLVVIAGAAAALLLHFIPDPTVYYEERVIFALVDRTNQLLLPQAGGGTSALVWAGGTALIWAIVAGIARWRRWRASAAVGLAVALGVVLVGQSIGVWQRDLDTAKRFRAGSPADFEWINHHSSGPVGVLLDGNVGGELADMELFNDHVSRVYVAQQIVGYRLQGPLCGWGVKTDGRLAFDPGCAKGAAPRQLLIEDPQLHMTFDDERASAWDPHVGRLVTVSGAPRAQAMVVTPCERLVRGFWVIGTMEAPQPYPCLDRLDMWFFSKTPGEAHVRFRNSPTDDHTAVLGIPQPGGGPAGNNLKQLERRVMRAGQYTDFVFRVPRGAFHRVIALDVAAQSEFDPALMSVELIENGRRRSLL